MKMSEVVSERFRGPQSQDFASWMGRFELGAQCTNMQDEQKVNSFLAYLESPCQELAMTFVKKYKTGREPPIAPAAEVRAYHQVLWKDLIAHVRKQSAFVGTRPELRLHDQWATLRQEEHETVGSYHHRLVQLRYRMAEQDPPREVDEQTAWFAFVRGLKAETRFHVLVHTHGKSMDITETLTAAEAFEDAHSAMEPPSPTSRGDCKGDAASTDDEYSELEALSIITLYEIGSQNCVRAAICDDISPSLISRRFYEQIAREDADQIVVPRKYASIEVLMDGRKLHVHGITYIVTELINAQQFVIIENLPTSRFDCEVVLGRSDLQTMHARYDSDHVHFRIGEHTYTFDFIKDASDEDASVDGDGVYSGEA